MVCAAYMCPLCVCECVRACVEVCVRTFDCLPTVNGASPLRFSCADNRIVLRVCGGANVPVCVHVWMCAFIMQLYMYFHCRWCACCSRRERSSMVGSQFRRCVEVTISQVRRGYQQKELGSLVLRDPTVLCPWPPSPVPGTPMLPE